MDVLERSEFEVKTFGQPSKETSLKMMDEITNLRQALSEAEERGKDARSKALEEAALWHDDLAMKLRGSQREKAHKGYAASIRAMKDEVR